MSTHVPCPNPGGSCGSMTHDPTKDAYAACVRAAGKGGSTSVVPAPPVPAHPSFPELPPVPTEIPHERITASASELLPGDLIEIYGDRERVTHVSVDGRGYAAVDTKEWPGGHYLTAREQFALDRPALGQERIEAMARLIDEYAPHWTGNDGMRDAPEILEKLGWSTDLDEVEYAVYSVLDTSGDPDWVRDLIRQAAQSEYMTPPWR